MSVFSRRDFLKLASRTLLAASSALGLGGIFRFLGYQTESSSPTEFDIGPVSDYPPGSRTTLSDIPAVVLHTADGILALSLTCTHLGCTVQHEGEGLLCACHGSSFGENGEVLRGPAKQPLNPLRVELNSNEHIILHA